MRADTPYRSARFLYAELRQCAIKGRVTRACAGVALMTAFQMSESFGGTSAGPVPIDRVSISGFLY